MKNPKAQKPLEEKLLSQSPNLLDQYDPPKRTFTTTVVDLKSSPLKLIGYFQKLIVSIQLLFLLVISVNYYLDSKIQNLSKETTLLDVQIRSYGATIKNADMLIRRIDRYKSLSNNRKLLSDHLSFINENSGDVTIQTLNITRDGVKISAEAPSALSIALLINNYFKNKDITAVILNTVSLDSSTSIFDVSLDVAFK